MVSLIARSPCEGLLPLQAGTTTLTELLPAAITSVAPQRGADMAAFKSATGAAFPAPNRATGKEGARAVWSGPGQCFWLGAQLADLKGFALTDQSDAWAVMRLEGADAEQVLARLTPIDLRKSTFKRGHTARTLLGHMACSITRAKDNAFDIMVFRSMAVTAVHELDVAMKSVAVRQG